MNRVEKYYDRAPEKEDIRLTRSAYDSIESEITKRIFTKYLSPSSNIAEIGCATGHYSKWLLEKDHNVHLIDLSAELLKLAEANISGRSGAGRVLGLSRLDAKDLAGLRENEFDATLLMGPLYHLIDEQDRIQCLKEAVRITKPGGLIFSATINRMCPFLAMLHDAPENLVLELTEDVEELHRIVESGVYENLDEDPNEFTDAYFANIDEVPAIYEKLKVENLEAFGCEGLGSYAYKKIEVIKKNPRAWERFLEVLFEKSNRPELLGFSEHVVFVGRKTSPKS